MTVFKMNKVVLPSLFRKPATRLYPTEAREYTDITKGHVAVDIDNCSFCTMCQKKCPTNAITVDKNERTWSIERMRCIQCLCCVWNCPKHCLAMDTRYTPPQADKIVDTVVGPPKPEKPTPKTADAAS